jgi:hypothetical protein
MSEAMAGAFDLWWKWARKPLDSYLAIPAELHEAVMALSEKERHDRTRVNKAATLRDANLAL